jgi:hypothetical protein
MTEFIRDSQGALFGECRVIGCRRDDMAMIETTRDHANEVIRAGHYSRTVYRTSSVHLAVLIDGAEVGVLQFGPAMNPASAPSIVAETAQDEYLELNRMWLDDSAPRNSESRALSLAFTYLRQSRPRVGWVQSFSDERCGRFGVVYQAAGFGYYGEHASTFWEIDGTFYHNSCMTSDPDRRPVNAFVQERRDRATPYEFRQFRYLKFLRRSFRSRCLLKEQPYPKHADEVSGEIRSAASAEGVGQFHPSALAALGVA